MKSMSSKHSNLIWFASAAALAVAAACSEPAPGRKILPAQSALAKTGSDTNSNSDEDTNTVLTTGTQPPAVSMGNENPANGNALGGGAGALAGGMNGNNADSNSDDKKPNTDNGTVSGSNGQSKGADQSQPVLDPISDLKDFEVVFNSTYTDGKDKKATSELAALLKSNPKAEVYVQAILSKNIARIFTKKNLQSGAGPTCSIRYQDASKVNAKTVVPSSIVMSRDAVKGQFKATSNSDKKNSALGANKIVMGCWYTSQGGAIDLSAQRVSDLNAAFSNVFTISDLSVEKK